jgi:hypothetical protein
MVSSTSDVPLRSRAPTSSTVGAASRRRRFSCLRSPKPRRRRSEVALALERLVLEPLHLVVELLREREVAVHDRVQHAVEQETDAGGREVRRGVPVALDLVHVEVVPLPDGDERARGDEDADFRRAELTRLASLAHRVRRREQVRLVAVELRTLAPLQGVLDGERMEPELRHDDLQVIEVRLAQVEPHDDGVVRLEQAGDPLRREAHVDELPAAIGAGAGRAARRPRPGDARRVRPAAVRLARPGRLTAYVGVGCVDAHPGSMPTNHPSGTTHHTALPCGVGRVPHRCASRDTSCSPRPCSSSDVGRSRLG